MKDVFTIHQADNGIMLKSDEYVEVMEDTHNADGKGKDNLYQRLGRYLYSLVKGTWASNPYVFVYEFYLID